MNNEVYASALQNTLNEIKNVCSDISAAFIFTEDGKVLAKDENTKEETINKAVDAFNAITKRADAIGGLESVTFHGANGRANIARVNDLYFFTVTSEEADEHYVNTLTRVLVPIVLKLVKKIHPASTEDDSLRNIPESPVNNYEKELPVKENVTKPEPEPAEEKTPFEINPEPWLPEPPVHQLIVENLRGLLVPSDTVRIDNAIIAEWKNLYGSKALEEVDVETLNGNATRCKFKPIKDSKYERKGIVQIPEKIQLTLQTAKGELAMVKPVVE
jgi:predicted regulator of Ras-like GTPase activity (Roadblock/LC7/MglB family)